MEKMMQLSASLEDYIEAIYHTVEAKGAARAKDIVLRMGVHNSSVTQALKSLSEKELVNYAPYDTITLTASGTRIAKDVVKRHETLRAFLGKVLGLPAAEADEGACRMEHAISNSILDRIVKFVEYFENCPANDIRWDSEIGYFCGRKQDHDGTCGRDACGHDLDLHLPDLKKPASREDG
jgi:DtxR family Mn-dependent transcriptional regulator